MPGMMEVYKRYAANYDELVNAEDWKNNLDRAIRAAVDWNDAVVYEAGIGTGRITKIYIEAASKCYGYDREDHMLEACRRNLSAYEEKLFIRTGINESLPDAPEIADIFIEGWSFGHTIIENENRYVDVFKRMHSRINSILGGSGTIILIESLGTNVSSPSPPKELSASFYAVLENSYGFEKQVLRTDYMFLDSGEAARVLGFFFGDRMAEDIIEKDIRIIPEYTGVWVKKL